MSRRHVRRKQKRPLGFKSSRNARRGDPAPSPLCAPILDLLADRNQPMLMTELMRELGIDKRRLPQLQNALTLLIETGKVVRQGRRFAIGQEQRLRATIDLSTKGFGFAVPVGEPMKSGKDIFIPARFLKGASQGDLVTVTLSRSSGRQREGRVETILKRGVTRLAGVFRSRGRGGLVMPDDERLPYTVLIPAAHTRSAPDNAAVLVELADYGSENQGPTGRVLEVLGDARSVAVQVRMAVFQADLHETFPEAVEQEASALSPVTAADGRLDLRHLPHVTIDGETARDFDDAICVEEDENGFTLYVSIADVSHYVRPGSALDIEAYARGTSVYLPGLVLPMLPKRLSDDLCSLLPDADRAAFTAILQFDTQGRRTGMRFAKSLIRSRKRLTYTTVSRLLDQPDEFRAEYGELLPMLLSADRLTRLLKQHRSERGSLEFEIAEQEISLHGDRITDIRPAERNRAHMLIEDCMLAANEAVAETLSRAGRNLLFRIHEQPDPEKLEAFTSAAKIMGLQLPKFAVTPTWFAQVIRLARNSPAEYVVNNLLLRAMQQARYSPENLGHFGLASPFYTHFTSPIRRYPDLLVHRALQAWLLHLPEEATALVPDARTSLEETGLHLSQCERKAVDAERDANARCAALFLLDREGEEFNAVISGVTAFGLYVSLEHTHISGLVPLTTMTDDFYLHDSRRHRLIGEGSNRIYQLGGQLRVRLEHVDLPRKRITFTLAHLAPEHHG